MRTTIRLDDGLLDEAKRLAARQGMTLTAVIEESLRERLARSRSAPLERRTRLATTGEGGVLPGVDLDDPASLFDLMDDRRVAASAGDLRAAPTFPPSAAPEGIRTR